MKIKIIALLGAMAISTISQAQFSAKKPDSGEPFAKKGTSSVNVYYGVSVFNGIYKNVASASAQDIRYSSLGPVGLMYEYIIADNVGIGAELGYRTFKLQYDYDGFDNNFNNVKYTDTYQFTSIRAMFRANFHFTHDEHFDAYGFVSAGYRSTTYKFTSTDPFFTGNSSFGGLIPFGVKPGIGIRYFFTENIGIHAEFALGTPLLAGGLSAKF